MWVSLPFSLLYLGFLVLKTGVLEQGHWQEPAIKLGTQETVATLQQHRFYCCFLLGWLPFWLMFLSCTLYAEAVSLGRWYNLSP